MKPSSQTRLSLPNQRGHPRSLFSQSMPVNLQDVPARLCCICLSISYTELWVLWGWGPTLIHLTLYPSKTFHNTLKQDSRFPLNICWTGANVRKGTEAGEVHSLRGLHLRIRREDPVSASILSTPRGHGLSTQKAFTNARTWRWLRKGLSVILTWVGI